MGQVILSDENCVGHSRAIFYALKRLGYQELLELELKTFDGAGLVEGTADEIVL